MANATNVLVTELDADSIRLERKLSEAEQKIAALEGRGVKGNTAIGASAEGMGRRYATASMQIASATESIARQGKIAGEAAKQMLNQGAQMAFAFGTGGAIAGAIAITTLAVVQLFTRARREMEETARQFDEKLADMRRSSNLMGAADLARQLYSGDRFAVREKDEKEGDVSLLARRAGLQGLRAEKARLEASLEPFLSRAHDMSLTPQERNAAIGAIDGDRKRRLNEVTDAITKQEGEYRRVAAAVEDLSKEETERARNRLNRQRDEDRQKDATASAKDAARDAQKFADDIAKLQHNLGLLDIGKILKEGGKEAEAFSLEMQGLAAEMTPTLVDDMRVALEQLVAELEKKGVGQRFIADVRTWKESLIKAQGTVEEFGAAMARMQAASKEGTLKPMGEMAELSQWESRIRAQIEALGTAKETEAARKVLAEQLNAIEKRRGELIAENTKRTDDATSASERLRKTTASIAGGIHAALSAAYSLAEAFGVADTKAGKLLRGVSELASGIENMAEGHVVSGGLQATAALVSIVKNLSGDPEHEEKVRAQEANTEALRKLTDGLTSLAGIQGSTISRASPFVDAIVRQTAGKSFRDKVYGIDNLGPQAYAAIKAAADALGITLDGTVDSFRQLQQAINEASGRMAEFGGTFAEQQAQWEAYKRIFGDQGAAGELGFLANTAGNQAPALQQLFSGLNLSDDGNREELRKRVQELFTTMMSGGDALDASAMGGLSRDDFVGVLGDIINALNALAPAAKSAGDQLKEALASIDAELEIMDVTDPGEQLQRRAGAYQAIGGSLGQLFEGLDLTDPAAVAELDARVRALFEQLQNSPESVDLAGLSIEELIAALLDLDGAADAVAAGVQSAADAFNEAVGQLDIDREIYGETDPTKYASDVAGAAGANFAEIGTALDGIDLSTPEGRAKAKKALQDLYTANKDNPALVGGIRSVIKALNAIPSEAAPGEELAPRATPAGGRESIANAARGVTEAVGNRMADYLRAIEINTAEFVRLAGGRGSVPGFPMLPTPLVPPFVPTRGAAGSGGLVVTIQAFVTVAAPDGDDPRLWGQIVGDGVAQAVNEEFAPWFDAALKRGGNLDRPGVS